MILAINHNGREEICVDPGKNPETKAECVAELFRQYSDEILRMCFLYLKVADSEKTGLYSTGIGYFEKDKDNRALRITFGYWENAKEGAVFRLSDQKIRVHYEMSGEKWRDTFLPVHDSLKKAVYRLVPVSDEKPEYEDYYIPKHLVISEYSFVILGEDINTIVPPEDRKRNGTYRLWGEPAWDIECTDKITEYTDDYLDYVMLGEKTPDEAWSRWGERDRHIWLYSKGGKEEAYSLGLWELLAYENEDTEYKDICISGDTFLDEAEKVTHGNETIYKNVPVHVENLTKMKYHGVEYRLEKVEDQKTLEAFLGTKEP
ncbi:MAG: hypothetical protein IJ733_11825 [Lachnospiraceae bacterium]|nr:hypothetical protein [Lachnospiraceae bacterium]